MGPMILHGKIFRFFKINFWKEEHFMQVYPEY